MNIIVLKENLKEVLLLVNSVISEKTNLNILKNIFIEVNDYIKIKATDLEISITSVIPGKIIEKGQVVAPLNILLGIINNLNSEKINLTTTNKKLNIISDNYKAKINTYPTNDFPVIPTIKESGSFIKINTIILKNSLSQIINSIKISDAHPELSGALLNFNNDITITSTDSFRLSEKTIFYNQFETNCKTPFKIIIPLKFIENVLKNFKNDKEIRIYFNNNQISIKSEKTEIVSRLINKEFPEYKNIIPSSYKTEVVVAVDAISNALKTTGLLSGKINEVRLNIEKKVIKVSSNDLSVGDSEYLVPCKTKGDNLNIAFNYKYLLDGLKSINEKNVFLGFNKENNPLVLKPIEDSSYLYILMPLRY